MRDEEAALLRAVIADRDDDEPRLVMADWYDDRGDPPNAARAEFIRAECQLARTPNGQLAARVAELCQLYQRDWNGPVHRILQTLAFPGRMRDVLRHVRRWGYRRGFIAEITASADAINEHADLLLGLGPVEYVRLRGGTATNLPTTLEILREYGVVELHLTVDGPTCLALTAMDLAWVRRLIVVRTPPWSMSTWTECRAAVASGRWPRGALLA